MNTRKYFILLFAKNKFVTEFNLYLTKTKIKLTVGQFIFSSEFTTINFLQNVVGYTFMQVSFQVKYLKEQG